MRSPGTSLSACVVLAAVLAACGGAPAQVEPENQREADVQPELPAYPSAENLVRVDLGPDERFEYWIDAQSITLGPGPVLLYTLVARSPEGASNVSFEAMQCRPPQRRIYALGRSDGSWAAARSDAWVPVGRSAKAYATLADYYFCPSRRLVQSADEALRAIRSRGHPDAVPAT